MNRHKQINKTEDFYSATSKASSQYLSPKKLTPEDNLRGAHEFLVGLSRIPIDEEDACLGLLNVLSVTRIMCSVRGTLCQKKVDNQLTGRRTWVRQVCIGLQAKGDYLCHHFGRIRRADVSYRRSWGMSTLVRMSTATVTGTVLKNDVML